MQLPKQQQINTADIVKSLYENCFVFFAVHKEKQKIWFRPINQQNKEKMYTVR